MIIKVVLIDDEPLARSIIIEYLAEYPQIRIVAECNDGFEGAKAIMEHQPDLIFLDIQMPKINGFEMLELVEEQPAVIFTTAFDEYAMRAFEQHAIDYLLKPIAKYRFDKAIEKFLSTRGSRQINSSQLLTDIRNTQPKTDRILVKNGSNIKIIPVTQVIYIEAADDYVNIHTAEGCFIKKATMNAMEEQLDPAEFVRIHRSYILGITHLSRIEPYEKESHIAILGNGAKINISKSGFARLKQILGM